MTETPSMLHNSIGGIQQIGVGVADAPEAFRWYRHHMGMDIRIFEDVGTASHMRAYTGDKAQARHAILAANLQGGGALEIWQYTNREPLQPDFPVGLGDLGIFAARIKAKDVGRALEELQAAGLRVPNVPLQAPDGARHFFFTDPFGLTYQVVEGREWFTKGKHITGGIDGCVIGVSDIEKSRSEGVV